MTRSYFAFLNYATALVFTLATVATGLAVTPALIHWLGQERFGAARMLLGIFGCLSLLEFGLAGALAPMLAKAVGQGDEDLVASTLAFAVKAYLRVTIVSLLVGGCLSFAIWKLGLIDVSPAIRGDLLCACFLSLPGLLCLPCIPFRVLLDVRQAGYVVNLALVGHALLVAALSVWFATHGGGISGQAGAISIGTITFYAFLAAAAARRPLGFARAASKPVDRELKQRLGRLGMPSMVMNVSTRFSVMSDDLIVGFLLEPAAVAEFFVFGRLAGLVRQQLELMAGSVWAGLTNLHVKGDHECFRKGIVDATKTICVVGASVLAPVVALNPSFVKLWIGGVCQATSAQWVCPAAAVVAILVALIALWTWVFTATGGVRLISAKIGASAAVNVAASVLLTYRFGMVGPLLGTIVAYAVVPIWYLPWRMHSEFGVDRVKLALAVLKPVLMGLFEAMLLRSASTAWPPIGWLMLSLEAAVGGLACLAINALLCFNSAEKAVWKNRTIAILAGLSRKAIPQELGRTRYGQSALRKAQTPLAEPGREPGRRPVGR